MIKSCLPTRTGHKQALTVAGSGDEQRDHIMDDIDTYIETDKAEMLTGA